MTAARARSTSGSASQHRGRGSPTAGKGSMVRYSLLCVVLLGVAGPARASSWADGMFDELSRDFGSVPRGQILTHPFRLVNNTGHPVHITGVRVSCGCTAARAL